MKPTSVQDWQKLSSDWFYEMKIDGHGGEILFNSRGEATLLNMSGNDMTSFLPPLIVPELADTHIQVEYAATRDGRKHSLSADVTSFLSDGGIDRVDNPTLYILEVYKYRGKSLHHTVYTDRLIFRENVKNHISKSWDIKTLEPATGQFGKHAVQILLAWFEDGIEGVVFKHNLSTLDYSDGIKTRTKHWLKHKPVYTIDAWVRSYTLGTGRNADRAGSLRLELLDENGSWVYIGSAKGGSDEQRDDFKRRLDAGEEFAVEVEFERWTINGALRFSSFKQERPDKTPQDCTMASQGPDSKKRLSEIYSPPAPVRRRSAGGWKPLVRTNSRMAQMQALVKKAGLALFLDSDEGIYYAVGSDTKLSFFYKAGLLGLGTSDGEIQDQIGVV